ncbi:MAG: hypothetical protein ACKO25_11430, partial [Cyanobium sp.]
VSGDAIRARGSGPGVEADRFVLGQGDRPGALRLRPHPALKAGWINNGDTAGFQSRLRVLAQRAWTISLAKYEPIRLHPWP